VKNTWRSASDGKAMSLLKIAPTSPFSISPSTSPLPSPFTLTVTPSTSTVRDEGDGDGMGTEEEREERSGMTSKADRERGVAALLSKPFLRFIALILSPLLILLIILLLLIPSMGLCGSR
jgi:hypothetical protein